MPGNVQKFNDVSGKVLKPKKNQTPTLDKTIRPFFSFSIVSECMVYPDTKLFIFFKHQKSWVKVNYREFQLTLTDFEDLGVQLITSFRS